MPWGARGPAVPQGRVLRPQLPLHSRPAVSRSQPGVWLSAARAALPLTLPFPPQPPGRAASTSVARCPQVPPALCAPLCPRGPAGGCTFVMRPRGSPGGDARGSARAPWVPVGQWVQREPTPEPCLWGPQCRTHGRRACGPTGGVGLGAVWLWGEAGLCPWFAAVLFLLVWVWGVGCARGLGLLPLLLGAHHKPTLHWLCHAGQLKVPFTSVQSTVGRALKSEFADI